MTSRIGNSETRSKKFRFVTYPNVKINLKLNVCCILLLADTTLFAKQFCKDAFEAQPPCISEICVLHIA